MSIKEEVEARVVNLKKEFELDDMELLERRIPAACKYYRKRVKELPDDADSWAELADWLSEDGQNREALKCAWKALELDPATRSAGNTVAALLTELEGPEACRNKLERLCEKYPKLAWPWEELSELHKKNFADKNAALEFAKEALEREPRNEDIQTRIEDLLAEMERWEDLAKFLSQIQEYQKNLWDEARVLERLADVLAEQLKRTKKAQQVRKEADRLKEIYIDEATNIDEDEADNENVTTAAASSQDLETQDSQVPEEETAEDEPEEGSEAMDSPEIEEKAASKPGNTGCMTLLIGWIAFVALVYFLFY